MGLLFISLSPLFSSCGEEEVMIQEASEDRSIENEKEFKVIDFTINTDSETSTRCYDNKYVYSLEVNQKNITGLPNDNCAGRNTIENLNLLIYNDKELLHNLELISAGSILNYSSKSVINSIKRNGNSVLLSLKMDKRFDPSKIRLVFSGGLVSYVTPNNGTYWRLMDYYKFNDTDNNDFTNIWNLHSDLCCNYFKEHYLSEDNDWQKVDTEVTLKRLNCDFIFLTTQYETSAPSQIESYLYAAPNSQDKIDNLYGKYTTSYSENNCRYFLEKDEVSFELGKGLVYRTDKNQVVYLTPSSGRPAIKLPSFSYNSKTVYLFSLFSTLGSLEPKYLINEDGEELKYITLIRYDAHKYYLMADQTHYYEWSTIPMPEGGIKANTRYIYILGNGFKFWQNRISKDELEDMAVTRSSEFSGDIQVEDVTIIEQSMDEPLPFENIEEE